MATTTRFRYSTSLEHDTLPVRTTRGEISVASAGKALSTAFRKARKEFPGTRWSSCVVVLEKLSEEEAKG